MSIFGLEVIKSKAYFMTNYSYVLYDKKERAAAIIDPAWDIDGIIKVIQNLNLHITGILLTHSHQDHVNLVDELTMRYHPDVYMSDREIQYYNYHCRYLTPVHHGQTITLGNGIIRCLSTPGHSYGSMCYLTDQYLFSGDTVFIEGCGMCGFQGSDPAAMYDSIQLVKEQVPSHTAVYPGHSFGKAPGYPMEYLRHNNIYFQIADKQTFIRFRMRKDQPNPFAFQ